MRVVVRNSWPSLLILVCLAIAVSERPLIMTPLSCLDPRSRALARPKSMSSFFDPIEPRRVPRHLLAPQSLENQVA